MANYIKLKSSPLRKLAAVGRALGDPSRLRILHALQSGELCVCQIIELLGLAPSTVSKHIAVLKAAELIRTHKCGRWIHCRLPDKSADAMLRRTLHWFKNVSARSPELQADQVRLKRLLKMDKATLCRVQMKR